MSHSIVFIEKELSKLQKINYNQFFWWRRWSVKNKPLPKNSPLIDKIKQIRKEDVVPKQLEPPKKLTLWERIKVLMG